MVHWLLLLLLLHGLTCDACMCVCLHTWYMLRVCICNVAEVGILEKVNVGLCAANVGVDLRKLGFWAAQPWATGIEPPPGCCHSTHLCGWGCHATRAAPLRQYTNAAITTTQQRQ